MSTRENIFPGRKMHLFNFNFSDEDEEAKTGGGEDQDDNPAEGGVIAATAALCLSPAQALLPDAARASMAPGPAPPPPPDAAPHAGRLEFSPEKAGLDVTPLNLEFGGKKGAGGGAGSSGGGSLNPLSGECRLSLPPVLQRLSLVFLLRNERTRDIHRRCPSKMSCCQNAMFFLSLSLSSSSTNPEPNLLLNTLKKT